MIEVVGGIIFKKGKFLLGKRSKKKSWGAGKWDIVGGHILKNEHPLLALRRECLEETGIDVRNAELLRTVEWMDDSNPFIYHIFLVTNFKGKPRNTSKEHSKLKWFSMEECASLDMVSELYLEMFKDVLQIQKP